MPEIVTNSFEKKGDEEFVNDYYRKVLHTITKDIQIDLTTQEKALLMRIVTGNIHGFAKADLLFHEIVDKFFLEESVSY